MSNSRTTSTSTSPIPFEYSGTVTGYMPLTYWDGLLHLLLLRLAHDFPLRERDETLNMALRDMQLVCCGRAASNSLAAWRKVAEKRGVLGDRKGREKAGKFWKALGRGVARVLDF